MIKKYVSGIFFGVVVLGASIPCVCWSGACDTNANALERTLNQRCASAQGAACRSCVEQQYNVLTRAVPQSCKDPGGAVYERRQEWESSHCQ